jgi:hypothetical protein
MDGGDFNLYDSFHETTKHPHMQGGQWTKAYQLAWKVLSPRQHQAILLRTQTESAYWNTFKNLIWYKSSVFVYRRTSDDQRVLPSQRAQAPASRLADRADLDVLAEALDRVDGRILSLVAAL